jgi:hypothetical protein
MKIIITIHPAMLNDLSTNFSAVTFLWDIFVIMAVTGNACLLD